MTDERAQLRRDLLEVSDQLAATTEVLTALGRSASDRDSVLSTIVESAARLCHSQAAQLYLVDGETFQLAQSVGLDEEYLAYLAEHPLLLDRGALIGRVGLERRTEQIVDVLADPDYSRFDLQRRAGYRTTIGSPLMLDDELVGVLLLWRDEVQAFDERDIALLETFSAQAAIAMRTLDLVAALDARSNELARKVDQLEALAGVSEAVSSSLDLDEVLQTIVVNAVRMSGADGGSIMPYVEGDRSFSVRSTYGTSEALIAKLRSIRIELDTTLVGRSARMRRPLQVPDLGAVERDPHLQLMYEDGWRSVLVAPMLRQSKIVGAFVIRRRTPGDFSTSTVDLLETLASQSALAIYNAGLFRELEAKSAELEIASQHKSEFLASMSHELRTPLNAVIGFSEVLLERMFGDINDRQEEYLRDIWSSGKHLLELLNEILDLSKVEAGRMELEASQFVVQDALEYTVSLMRERATAHAISLELQVDDQVGEIDADELRFKQVVLNLVSNAVKFTPDGGSVSVRAWVAGEDLHVSISDTGPGIPEEDQERIFESFQQGGRGAPKEEGTGLGLTLSRRIVHLFGGRLWLDSTPGMGSVFGFTMPLERERDATGLHADTPLVLVIEDDWSSLDLLTAYLEGAGVEIAWARDGEDGLDKARRTPPAAIVLDLRLPGMDGWEVLSSLKGDPVMAEIPVVVTSILDESTRGLDRGASAYLTKPFSREKLLDALSGVGVISLGRGAQDNRAAS